jgi:hypothetical protein
MKTKTTPGYCIPAAAIILAATLAITAAAQQQVPFKGAMQGNDTDTAFTDTTVTVLTVGSGIGTQLGQFTFTQTAVVNFTNGQDTGTATWFAASKDSLSTTFYGSGEVIGPNLFSITEHHTITGGTGRFAGAQGTFTVTRMASGTTFLTSGSFLGTITPPGAVH